MCISFWRFVSKLYTDFRKDTREKELNVTKFAVATSARSRISRVRERWFQSACARIRIRSYCILLSIRSFLYRTRFTSRKSPTIVNHRHSKRPLAIFVCRKCKGDVRCDTERSSVFLKLFQNDSFFMPNLSTELFYKLERRRGGERARRTREMNVSRYSRYSYKIN